MSLVSELGGAVSLVSELGGAVLVSLVRLCHWSMSLVTLCL